MSGAFTIRNEHRKWCCFGSYDHSVGQVKRRPSTALQISDVTWGIIVSEVVTTGGRSGVMALHVD
jgi:hypothetical protein